MEHGTTQLEQKKLGTAQLGRTRLKETQFGTTHFGATQPGSIAAKWVYAAAAVFIAELILGFNGRLLLIYGVPVRMATYAVLAVSLGIAAAHAIRTSGRPLVASGRRRIAAGKAPLLTGFDWCLAAFLLFNAIWVLIVPAGTGYGIGMAVKQTVSMSLLLLYFPLVVLLRTNGIRWHWVQNVVQICLFSLALLHLVLYVGETLAGDASFAIRFFETVGALAFGHSERPVVMYPMNYYKIVYPVSLYLLMIVYFTLKRERLSAMSVIFYAAGLGALLVTLTKSLWFGAVGGLLVYAGVYAAVRKKGGTALHRRDADLHKADESETGEHSTDEGQANGRRINAGKANGRKAKGRKAAVLAIVTVVVGIIMNETLLDNYLLMRLHSAIATGHSEQIRAGQIVISDGQNEELRVLDEREGTKRANDTRIEQTKVLLKKWAERPWTGFGYGSYAEEMRRGPADKPYLYEMLLPSLLMQIGGLGILGWIVYFVYLIRYVCKRAPGELPVVYLLAAIGLASQFNPFLLGSAAMSMILYALLAVQVQAERLDRAGEPS